MKYLKSYRLFESDGLSTIEMLELGLLDWEDIPGLINSLDRPARIELVKPLIEKYGFDRALKLFGDREIIKRAYQNNPSDYLNQFNDLTEIEKDDGDIIYYVDKDRLPLFFYYRNGEYVYINYKIWGFYTDIVELENPEIEHIIKNWLEETYNIKGLEPYYNETFYSYFWKTPII